LNILFNFGYLLELSKEIWQIFFLSFYLILRIENPKITSVLNFESLFLQNFTNGNERLVGHEWEAKEKKKDIGQFILTQFP
jgi:hypothetical protein